MKTNHREVHAAGRVLAFALRGFTVNALAMFVVVSLLILFSIWGLNVLFERLVWAYG